MDRFVARLCRNIPTIINRVVGQLESAITERLRATDMPTVDGNDDRKGTHVSMFPSALWNELNQSTPQNDLLQWLIESAPPGRERTVPALALRVLVVNFAALHTTSTVSTRAS